MDISKSVMILTVFLVSLLAPQKVNSEEASASKKIRSNPFINAEHIIDDQAQRVLGPKISGRYVPELAGFDQAISGVMLAWNIQGGSVALAKDGKIIYARGFGISDSSGKEVLPDSLFRVASVSKIITGMAILRLCNESKLKLSDKVVPLLKELINESKISDDRWKDITVENLLYHNSGIPQNDAWAKRIKSVSTDKNTPSEAVKYLIGQRLDFTPGSQNIYNNQNYLFLGRIIECVTGIKYSDYVKKELLVPMGILNMEIGRSKKNQKYPKEVEYGLGQNLPKLESVSSMSDEMVDAPYSYSLESMDSFGGWIASAADLVRFVTFFDGFSGPKDFIDETFWQKMVYKPEFPYIKDQTDPWQGIGWQVRKNGSGFNYWHCGSIWGTKSEVVRTADGYVWSWIFNGEVDQNVVDQLMWLAKSKMPKVPDINLTPELFPNSNL